ncbi:MAG: GNAT family N-acetyltransferase [Solirubrobacteraceae bacterium]|nr:GNAT family N-acetyltransferase [Solirubrobacteraceae bacterium]
MSGGDPAGLPLFGSVELAADIERAEAGLMAACAEVCGLTDHLALPIGGGWATYCGVDSPFTKVAGLGFAPAPTDAELARVEAEFGARGAAVTIELATLAGPQLGERLTARGYRLIGVEDVLGVALPAAVTQPASVDVAVTDDLDAWIDADVRGTLAADADGVPNHDDFAADAITTALRELLAAGTQPYLATRGGVPAGAGSLRLAGRIAQLTGASTIPAHRREGVQTALLAARLRDAHAAGCEIAVVTTQPGSTSQRNVRRAGFALLYSRMILSRPVGEAEAPAARA